MNLLISEVVDLAERLSVGTYELLVLVGELDDRGAWMSSGALTCAGWLADVCGIEISTARSQIRVARAMREHPVLDHAMAAGEVSYAKARVLAAYLTVENASALVEIAETTPASRLGAAIAAWTQRNEDEETIRCRQHEMRSVSWRTDPDGMVTITARLTPDVAAGVCAVIDKTVMADGAPAVMM